MKSKTKSPSPRKLSVSWKKDPIEMEDLRNAPKDKKMKLIWCESGAFFKVKLLFRKARAYWGKGILPYR